MLVLACVMYLGLSEAGIGIQRVKADRAELRCGSPAFTLELHTRCSAGCFIPYSHSVSGCPKSWEELYIRSISVFRDKAL